MFVLLQGDVYSTDHTTFGKRLEKYTPLSFLTYY